MEGNYTQLQFPTWKFFVSALVSIPLFALILKTLPIDGGYYGLCGLCLLLDYLPVYFLCFAALRIVLGLLTKENAKAMFLNDLLYVLILGTLSFAAP